MKQIKTIKNRLDDAEDFDVAVNAALAEGWQLTKRSIIQPHAQSIAYHTYITLYAELEREIIAEEGREIIAEEEQCCENCAHCNKRGDEEPCHHCTDLALKWEPAT